MSTAMGIEINKHFAEKKRLIRMSTDLSRKGDIDEPIKEIIEFINNLEEFVTTSSCSGRIIILNNLARLRPDLVVIDRDRKSIKLVDVTMPYEDGCQSIVEARERKYATYDPLAQTLRAGGFHVTVDAFVVGSLGAWDKAKTRHIYMCEDGDSSKRGCKWILTSHTTVDSSEVLEKVKCCEKNMVLKFEPFILHVQCEDIIAAKKMQNCALAAGFRNSGSVFGRGGNITFAVRGTHGLEVPLSDEERLLVTDDYIRHIVDKANSKMCENMKKIENFSRAVHDLKTSKGHPGFETT
ncbi:tRNA wybutosine-synthesizing protein 3 homolog isoform X2 [Homalodisca vitripennis]|uniref:tRNA wybutosine-synthesizing protein 3 homolog isoform X2 n=1 Tax=Homalodisca vitripennis TaxID=197043 RepID=UPI001EEA6AE3|nr:tRNA wybutosine-synthesizing protein 3 homolog isoform X2 [Homalodisca vitripennis]